MTRPTQFALVFLALAFAGCAGPKKEAEVDANGKKIEYVWYTPTGSNMPVKVRKDSLQQSDSQTEHDKDAMQRAQQRGLRPAKDGG